MVTKSPTTNDLRTKGNVIDQRQQQIDPAGKHRADPNDAAKGSQKQPGHPADDPKNGGRDAE